LERVVRELGLRGAIRTWVPAIQFCQQVLGVDRVLYAMDYPYQFEAGEVGEMDALGTDLDRSKFYELNARRVFGL
jgi:2,3-dihydroxybenzoate decarboxylase